MARPFPEVMIGGIRIAAITRARAAGLMVEQCHAARERGARPQVVFTANGNSISLAARDPSYRALLESADMIRADGQPVVIASRLTKTPIPERSATTDFVHDAAAAARHAGLRFYLLGATEEINARAAAALARQYPGLVIAGRRHGYFTSDDEPAIIAAINAADADVVWLGMGLPREQSFAVRNRTKIRAGWLITCGGCLNFLAGDYRRAPLWMQKAGLEWLHRLAREPRRLFWRYAVSNPHALYLMLTRSRALEAAP
jgi:exopolysaccharide biosynthesis WecB/TagA/CpsF family protein